MCACVHACACARGRHAGERTWRGPESQGYAGRLLCPALRLSAWPVLCHRLACLPFMTTLSAWVCSPLGWLAAFGVKCGPHFRVSQFCLVKTSEFLVSCPGEQRSRWAKGFKCDTPPGLAGQAQDPWRPGQLEGAPFCGLFAQSPPLPREEQLSRGRRGCPSRSCPVLGPGPWCCPVLPLISSSFSLQPPSHCPASPVCQAELSLPSAGLRGLGGQRWPLLLPCPCVEAAVCSPLEQSCLRRLWLMPIVCTVFTFQADIAHFCTKHRFYSLHTHLGSACVSPI